MTMDYTNVDHSDRHSGKFFMCRIYLCSKIDINTTEPIVSCRNQFGVYQTGIKHIIYSSDLVCRIYLAHCPGRCMCNIACHGQNCGITTNCSLFLL